MLGRLLRWPFGSRDEKPQGYAALEGILDGTSGNSKLSKRSRLETRVDAALERLDTIGAAGDGQDLGQLTDAILAVRERKASYAKARQAQGRALERDMVALERSYDAHEALLGRAADGMLGTREAALRRIGASMDALDARYDFLVAKGLRQDAYAARVESKLEFLESSLARRREAALSSFSSVSQRAATTRVVGTSARPEGSLLGVLEGAVGYDRSSRAFTAQGHRLYEGRLRDINLALSDIEVGNARYADLDGLRQVRSALEKNAYLRKKASTDERFAQQRDALVSRIDLYLANRGRELGIPQQAGVRAHEPRTYSLAPVPLRRQASETMLGRRANLPEEPNYHVPRTMSWGKKILTAAATFALMVGGALYGGRDRPVEQPPFVQPAALEAPAPQPPVRQASAPRLDAVYTVVAVQRPVGSYLAAPAAKPF